MQGDTDTLTAGQPVSHKDSITSVKIMKEFYIPEADLQRFGEDCLVAVGSSREHAAEHIAVLVEADKRGHYSHGDDNLKAAPDF